MGMHRMGGARLLWEGGSKDHTQCLHTHCLASFFSAAH